MTDQLRDNRAYRVAEPTKAVWFGGNCINHSTQTGFGIPPIAVLKLVPPCANFDRRKPVSLARGVGYNPEAIPPVRRVKGVKRDTMPLRIIPERAELAEHGFQSTRAKDRTVLKDDSPWPKIGDEADNLTPKPTLRPLRSSHSAGEADVLAGEAPADDVNGNSICAQSVGGKVSNVMVAGNLRPVAGKDRAGVRFNLAERDRLESTRALKAQVEPADAREERKDAQLFHSNRPPMLHETQPRRGGLLMALEDRAGHAACCRTVRGCGSMPMSALASTAPLVACMMRTISSRRGNCLPAQTRDRAACEEPTNSANVVSV